VSTAASPRVETSTLGGNGSHDLYDRPVNRFVAGFIGSPAMNLCEVPLGANGAVSFGGEKLELDDSLAALVRANGRAGVVLGLRPEALELGSEGVPARVEVIEELGADAFVFCTAEVGGASTRLVARTEARLAPAQGERISLRPRPDQAHLFDAETGARLER
jgi:multiple sugar transport system ATP-binding protein